MKRSIPEFSNHPKDPQRRRDVAGGRPCAKGVADLASFRHVSHEFVARRSEDATLIEEFADFLAGDEVVGAEMLPAPDPEFAERLRRRLLRDFVHSKLRDHTGRH